MVKEAVTIQDLDARVSEKLGISKYKARKVFDAYREAIRDTLSNNKDVQIQGLCTFRIKQTKERAFSDFHGNMKTCPAHRIVKCKVSKTLQ